METDRLFSSSEPAATEARGRNKSAQLSEVPLSFAVRLSSEVGATPIFHGNRSSTNERHRASGCRPCKKTLGSDYDRLSARMVSMARSKPSPKTLAITEIGFTFHLAAHTAALSSGPFRSNSGGLAMLAAMRSTFGVGARLNEYRAELRCISPLNFALAAGRALGGHQFKFSRNRD
jgi:hypothetical protein